MMNGQDIHNVSDLKFNTGISYDSDTIFGKFNIRYMGERKDKDWYSSGYPVITYESFTVCDLSVGVRFKKRHKIKVSVDNIFDKNYYEKPEYPLPGTGDICRLQHYLLKSMNMLNSSATCQDCRITRTYLLQSCN